MRSLAALALIAASLGLALSGGASAQSVADVEVRDQLIADQENLLNTYRCLFGTDTEVVPGGCDNPDTIVAGAAPQSPTQGDLDVRDGLIQSQEALLNVYRCQHNVDTQLVPGGCATDEEATEEPPTTSGPWMAVSAGPSHACGLRTDGTITCWGDFRFDGGGVPEGQFIDVSSRGYFRVCGLTSDGIIRCDDGQPLDGNFTKMTTGGGQVCGITADRTISCRTWRHSAQQLSPISGQFTAVSVDGGFQQGEWDTPAVGCGIRTDQSLACWGPSGYESPSEGPLDIQEPPEGSFTAVSTNTGLSCGLRTDGTITCWTTYTPAARSSYPIEFWLQQYDSHLESPDGQFVSLSVGRSHACALGNDGKITCWGNNHAGQLDAPHGEFAAVSAGSSFSCGLGTDGMVACWGNNDDGQLDVPGSG